MEEQNTTTQEEVKQEKQSSPLGVPAKTIILVVVLALVAGLLTYVAISPKKLLPQIANNPKESVKNPADTTLSILPSTKDAKTSQYSSIVYIDSGKNEVIGTQLELYYDPKIVTNVSIVPMEFFKSSTEALKKIDQVNGRITYALGVSVGENGIKGKGNLAKITYTIIPNATIDTAAFNFLPKTEVSGMGTDLSLLKSTNDGEINIDNPSSQTQIPGDQ